MQTVARSLGESVRSCSIAGGWHLIGVLVLLLSVAGCPDPYRDALAALDAGDVPGAGAIIQPAFDKNPNRSDLRLGMIRWLLAANEPAKALEHVRFLKQAGVDEALRSDFFELSGTVLHAVGREQLQQESFGAAKTTLTEALEFLDTAEVRTLLGAAFLALEEPASALEHFAAATAASPGEFLGWLGTIEALDALEKADEALAALEKGLKATGNSNLAVELARRHFASGQKAEAKAILGHQLSADPDCFGCYELLVSVHESEKAWDAALAVHALRRSAHPAVAEFCLAEARMLEKRKKARADAAATVAACLDGLEEAEEAYREYVRLAEMDYRSSLSKRKANLEAASQFLDGHIARHPERGYLTSLRAEVLFDAGEKETAFGLLREAVAQRPEAPGPLVVLARLTEIQGQKDEAQTLLDQALTKPGAGRSAVEARVGHAVRRKDWDGAQAALESSAAKRIPDEEWRAIAERMVLQKDLKSCVQVGHGRPKASTTYSDYSRSWDSLHKAYEVDNAFWTASTLKRGYVTNHCRATTVDVGVRVTFTIKEVTHAFIFANVRRKTKKKNFSLRNIAPGETKSFKAATSTGSLSLASGWMGTSESVESVKVSTWLSKPKFELRPK